MSGDVVDGHALLQVVWVSLVTGLVLVGAMAATIVGFARAGQERRERRAAAAGGFVALAVAGCGVIAGAVVLGVAIMLHKG